MTDKIKNKLTNPILVCFLAGFCCLLWGSAFPAIKVGYALLSIAPDDYMSQILFAGVRFTFAGFLTIAIGSIMSKSLLKVSSGGAYKIPLLAIFQTILQYLFFYVGLAHTSGTKGSILNSVSVFFAVLIAALVLRQERLTAGKLVGCILGFCGVILINLTGGGFDTSMSFVGEGFIILSSLSYAASSVLIKQFSQSDNPVALSGYQFLLGGIVMTVIGFSFGGRLSINSFKAVLLIAYLAFLSAAAYTLWGVLLKYNTVSRVTVFGFMTPIFGCILSAIALNEVHSGNTLRTIAALVLVCAGIFIVNNLKSTEKKYEG